MTECPCSNPNVPAEQHSDTHPTLPRPYATAVFAAIVAFTCAILALSRLPLDAVHPIARLFLALVPLHGAALATFLLVLMRNKRQMSFIELLEWHPQNTAEPFKYPFPVRLLCLIIASLCAGFISITIFQMLEIPQPPQHVVAMLRNNLTWPFALATFCSVAIIAPVAEELLFRLGCFNCLKNTLPENAATIATSLIFAFAHGQLNTLLSLFVVGYGLQQEMKKGGLKQAILLHAAYNSTQFILVVASAKLLPESML